MDRLGPRAVRPLQDLGLPAAVAAKGAVLEPRPPRVFAICPPRSSVTLRAITLRLSSKPSTKRIAMASGPKHFASTLTARYLYPQASRVSPVCSPVVGVVVWVVV